jgi:hypothetical protein
MTQLVQSLLERLAQLPEPVQNRLAKHFLQELEEAETQINQQPRKRRAGLGKGTIVIADDFDEPLPDAFGSALHVMLAKRFHATVDQKRFPRQRRSTESDDHQRCVSTVSVSQAQEKWPHPQRQTESSMPRLWSPICRMRGAISHLG